MNPRLSAFFGLAGLTLTALLAWFSIPLQAQPSLRITATLLMNNSTPSISWSPDSRHLALHHLQTAFPRGFYRATSSRYLRRATSSRYLRRATSSGFRSATTSRYLRRATTSRYLRRATTSALRSATTSVALRRYRHSRRLARTYTTFVTMHHPQSALMIVEAATGKRYVYQSSSPLRSSTDSKLTYFRPRWVTATHILTSASFGGEASGLFDRATAGFQKFEGLTTAELHPSAGLVVGRRAQTGVFLARIDRPEMQVALVDERRKVGGARPAFSPNGRLLAWLDTTHDFEYAPLKVFSFPYTAAEAFERATLKVPDPWELQRKSHPALLLRPLPLAFTAKVTSFAWHPDSNHIAYTTERTQGADRLTAAFGGGYPTAGGNLYLLSVENGKRPARLLEEDGSDPTFASNGELYYARSQKGIWAFSLRTGKKRQILPRGISPKVSPDGRYLAFLEWFGGRPSPMARLMLRIVALP